MTRAEQPTASHPAPDDTLVADSRERAVRALLRRPQSRRLWSAHLVSGVGDTLALLVLVLLAVQAAIAAGSFGGGYRGVAFAVATVFAVRILATLLFGAVLLGPLTSLTSPDGPLDRRLTMVGADGLRAVLLIIAPLWIDWTPDDALAALLATAFVVGVAERFWTVCRESAAPALLPAPPPEGASVRPLPDHMDALRRLSLRTSFVAVPLAALALVVAGLVNNLLGAGADWFAQHQAALAAYVAAGLFAGSLALLLFLELPGTRTPRARSPLEGLRRPRTAAGPEKGRTGALPLLVLACTAVAGAIAAAVAVAVLHAKDLGGGPVLFGLLAGALTGGVVVGIRTAPALLPSLSRRRLLSLAIAFEGVALLAAGLVPDNTTVLLLAVLAGAGAGIAANIGHALLDQETDEHRRTRTTEHLHACVRVCAARRDGRPPARDARPGRRDRRPAAGARRGPGGPGAAGVLPGRDPGRGPERRGRRLRRRERPYAGTAPGRPGGAGRRTRRRPRAEPPAPVRLGGGDPAGRPADARGRAAGPAFGRPGRRGPRRRPGRPGRPGPARSLTWSSTRPDGPRRWRRGPLSVAARTMGGATQSDGRTG
ncbi:hypothetical protein SFUMM280S_04638 [Streptomyces fumanus]